MSLRDLLEQTQKTSAAELRGDLRTAIAELKGMLDRHAAETGEKFTGVYNQFAGNDKALTAALQAQEKQAIATDTNNRMASNKMEDGFTKLTDAVVKTLDTKTANLEASIGEVKLQMNTIMSRLGTTSEVRRDSRDNTSLIISGFMGLIALGSLIILAMTHIPK